jgi:sirohydrochlorin ferrochelatase
LRSSKPSVILVGHGSKLRGFDWAMKRVAKSLKKGPFACVICAYLEITKPSIPQAVKKALRFSSEVRLVPYFLLSGRHINEHIPQIAADERKKWPKAKIVLRPYLGFDERIADVVKERAIRG